MRFDFDDIDAAQQVVAGLDPADQEEFWIFVQKTLIEDAPGAAHFMGKTTTVVDCECGPEGVIHPLTPISDDFRDVLSSASHTGGLAPRGAVLNRTLFLYCGPDIGRGRLYLTPIEAAFAFLDKLFPAAGLTPAERDLVLDLLVGFELRQTADRDSISYETKRTFLKRALHKTGLSSQSQLTSRVLSSFLIECHEAFRETREAFSGPKFRDWVEYFSHPGLRSHTVLDAHDQHQYLIDIGPADGSPIIACMPTIFPFIHPEYVDETYQLGLRILMPLRRGAFDPNLKDQTAGELSAATRRGIKCAADLLGKPATLLGFSNGCAYALDAALQNDNSEETLILVSPLLPPDSPKHPVDALRTGFMKLAAKAPRLRNLTLKYLKSKVETPEKFRDFLIKLAPKGSEDQKVIANEFEDDFVLTAYHEYVQNSFALFLADNHPELALTPQALTRMTHPVHILHGEKDAITKATHLREIGAACEHAEFTQVPNAGHVMRFDAFLECLRQIQRIVG